MLFLSVDIVSQESPEPELNPYAPPMSSKISADSILLEVADISDVVKYIAIKDYEIAQEIFIHLLKKEIESLNLPELDFSDEQTKTIINSYINSLWFEFLRSYKIIIIKKGYKDSFKLFISYFFISGSYSMMIQDVDSLKVVFFTFAFLALIRSSLISGSQHSLLINKISNALLGKLFLFNLRLPLDYLLNIFDRNIKEAIKKDLSKTKITPAATRNGLHINRLDQWNVIAQLLRKNLNDKNTLNFKPKSICNSLLIIN